MSGAEFNTIEIMNWDRYQEKRKDIAHCSWFRFAHSFAFDPEWSHLDGQEKWVFVYILCTASMKNRGSVNLTPQNIEIGAKISAEKVSSAIQKLTEKNAVRVRHAHVTRTSRTRSLTDRHNRQDRQTGQTEQNTTFDFDSLYRKYPRKINPSEGKKRAAQVIKTREDYESLSKAIDRYSEYVRERRTEERFILHFSTFIENRKDKPFTQPWRDWLDPETGRDTQPAISGLGGIFGGEAGMQP